MDFLRGSRMLILLQTCHVFVPMNYKVSRFNGSWEDEFLLLSALVANGDAWSAWFVSWQGEMVGTSEIYL